jgi:hypothetical protein
LLSEGTGVPHLRGGIACRSACGTRDACAAILQITPRAASIPEAGGVFMEERMSALVMGLPRLAPLALSGMLFLSLSANPSSAQVSGLHAGKPGQVREVIGPSATVIATEHYQAELTLSCGLDVCSGSFPKPGNKHRQNITRISCYVDSTDGSTFNYGFAELKSANNVRILRQWLPADHSSSAGVHTLNRAVDMQVGSEQNIRVVLFVDATSTVGDGYCTASGTRDTLQ